MTREQATETVQPFVFRVKQFAAVGHLDAFALLGDERCTRMLKCPVRGLGPTKETVYPWNVIDYLQFEHL